MKKEWIKPVVKWVMLEDSLLTDVICQSQQDYNSNNVSGQGAEENATTYMWDI